MSGHWRARAEPSHRFQIEAFAANFLAVRNASVFTSIRQYADPQQRTIYHRSSVVGLVLFLLNLLGVIGGKLRQRTAFAKGWRPLHALVASGGMA